MRTKKLFLTVLVLGMAASSFGCGKESSKSEEKNSAKETTTEAAEEETTKKDNKGGDALDGLSLGMLGYVEKSKQTSANINAKTLYHSVMCVLTDEEKKIANDIIYTKTGEGEFGEKVNEYFAELAPLEYIVIPDDYGQPKAIICCGGTSRKDKVGVYGDIGDADEIREMKWKKVLEKFGLEYKNYTDIELEKDDLSNYSYTHEEPQGIDFDDADAVKSCDLAAAIAWEYNRGEEDIPVYLYGKWSKDTPLTVLAEETDWEVPEHGDIEYVLEYNGFSVINVFCWDTECDKKYVGDADMGYGYTNFVGKTWDDVLEYYGYKQGEYVEY
ncbi:hypothetical protein [Ruminococcus flavefaciens]|uniref:hypothetical protein n=1 Tax=Ruminococcus flavefaciens TaxID=1265 RepID=UPI00048E3549|nr:hypothetical protein [Ruminococcus flavefaciens]